MYSRRTTVAAVAPPLSVTRGQEPDNAPTTYNVHGRQARRHKIAEEWRCCELRVTRCKKRRTINRVRQMFNARQNMMRGKHVVVNCDAGKAEAREVARADATDGGVERNVLSVTPRLASQRYLFYANQRPYVIVKGRWRERATLNEGDGRQRARSNGIRASLRHCYALARPRLLLCGRVSAALLRGGGALVA